MLICLSTTPMSKWQIDLQLEIEGNIQNYWLA